MKSTLSLSSGWTALALVTSSLLTLSSALVAKDSGLDAFHRARDASSFWVDQMTHNGAAAFGDASYVVYRNVKDFGAKGDGTTDDTVAINNAVASISKDNTSKLRCGMRCNSTSIEPAVVFFPAGNYLVSKPIVSYFFTQLIGDAITPPTLTAAAGFAGMAVIDVDPYGDDGNNWFINQGNFYRQLRNFVIDLTAAPAGTGVHYQVGQATTITNVHFKMSPSSSSQQQGIFMENGSGGFMSDLTFTGGKLGIFLGGQQFTFQNITFDGQAQAIEMIWDWGMTFVQVTFTNCGVGLNMTTLAAPSALSQGAGSVVLLDSTISNTPVGISTTVVSNTIITLENLATSNVPAIVSNARKTALAGSSGSTPVAAWQQGSTYHGTTSTPSAGVYTALKRSTNLVDQNGKYFIRTRPQYADQPASAFVNVKSQGAKGDGTTDDTAALQKILNANTQSIIFFPQGTYVITDTLNVPVGSRLTGEAWSVLMGSGTAFGDATNPKVVIQVGKAGDTGVLEMSDLIFSTQGSTPGAIVVEWNVGQTTQGSAGMWDCHFRLGGFQGSKQTAAECPTSQTTADKSCFVAFLALHITSAASFYGSGTWVWVADHDLDLAPNVDISLYSGRGILVESKQGPVWFYGTASEHHVLYQYNIVNSANVLIAMAQTETPYYQGKGFSTATDTVAPVATYNDPTFADCKSGDTSCNRAWGMRISNSSDVFMYTGGFYSFFDTYTKDCLNTTSCQTNMVSLEGSQTSVQILNLNTVGTANMLSNNLTPQVAASKNVLGFANSIGAWFSS